ncbi:MAG TPA: CSLREA domain-containing protein [Herpetosiphon sp.]|uniref:CSLREA domain-containing protein n=1 Tax=Herpetosiphon aurantiacus (strain ATCC 23779 / DSM 785 / 114-95) TaxID=316274 RepID=A9AYR7_HERA2|nr:CSLREA domain-containing protein [Herpetosiphon sp.]ABX05045.1 hypothetical protein Haur_2405 [Herpetosiphon aurantiacus DSM 785]HBW52905.1 CSLREA domain-containing protein [Herpetosiphon sp.]
MGSFVRGLLVMVSFVSLLGLMLPAQAASLQTTFVVTTADDDFIADNGTCSLREALYAANTNQAYDACPAGGANDTIQLAAANYRLTRTGMNDETGVLGDLDILSDLTITGVSSATTIIDGMESDRVLDIYTATVTLNNLQIRNGFVDNDDELGRYYGHGILQRYGNLQIQSSLIERNGLLRSTMLANNYGGGIASLNGTLSIVDSTIRSNALRSYVDGFDEGSGHGAGLYISSQAVTITNSLFDNNQRGFGPAIYMIKGNLSLLNSVIQRSSDSHQTSAAINVLGGQLRITGGGLLNNTPQGLSLRGASSATLADTTFVGNGSSDPNARECSRGGAIYNAATLSIMHSRFIGNYADLGGALYQHAGKATLLDSEWVENRSSGGVRNDEECFGYGGAIYQNLGVVTLDTSTIAHNYSFHTGSGIAQLQATAIMTITNSTIVSNTNRYYEYDPEYPDMRTAGLYATGRMSLGNTIVANNYNTSVADAYDCMGTVLSLGHNLLEHPRPQAMYQCIFQAQASDQLNLDPILDQFDFHSGTTRSYSLNPLSPAIDAGADCGPFDQRGIPRPQDGDGDLQAVCDIGAFEYSLPAPTRFMLFAPYISQ